MKRIFGAFAVIVLMTSGSAFAQSPPTPSLFRILKGDVLTFEYVMAGNLFETTHPAQIELQARQNMWVRMSGNKVEASLDDLNFHPIREFASGTLEVGVADPSASKFTINLLVNAK
jgi:hypothetical protein